MFAVYNTVLLNSLILFPQYLNSVTWSVIFQSVIIFSLLISLPHIPISFLFDVEIFKLYFFEIVFKWCAEICNSSSHLEINTWSSAYTVALLNVSTW
jgi:hypothetical protein